MASFTRQQGLGFQANPGTACDAQQGRCVLVLPPPSTPVHMPRSKAACQDALATVTRATARINACCLRFYVRYGGALPAPYVTILPKVCHPTGWQPLLFPCCAHGFAPRALRAHNLDAENPCTGPLNTLESHGR